MIKIEKGNLLHSKAHIIGHQVNCQGAMNSGVAKQIRETFPLAYQEYKEFVDANSDCRKALLGGVQYAKINDSLWIANMFGQLNYGYDGEIYTNTNALFECFKDLRENAEEHGLSVALPYMIGCYRGGASWRDVEDLLLTAFDGYEVTLYKLHKG